ncbi:hypothetical protein VB151_11695 [Xanthomonas fragariae]|nr:hypothetical protein [Xanthomonas fragariae]MDM7555169.1 hypothetical protein [Xanthomonas fragariae]MDM7558291.1 hypothetical protein [Xanthomonas fragariae]MDM7572884.1 hypothetical protein [Xanthomonas fragariae]MDM7575985.1 hypothetical protein [Xanthomonas fragariae]MDM7579057.1 hypothetical protein [Xanthomonas fragariae]
MSDTPESRYAAVARRVVEAHEAQLLRDLQLINERTVRELGPLPHGGLPVQPKRKPKRAPWEQPVVDPPTLDADAPLLPQTPLSDIGDPDMFKFSNPFKKKRREPWPLRFDSYSFDARCYHTLRCSIIFDRQQHSLHLADPSGDPYAPDWKDDWRGGFGSTEEFETRGFPSTVDIRWTAMDGVERYVEVDLEKIFPGHLMLHNVAGEDIDEFFLVYGYSGNGRNHVYILLEVNDRTINVYMRADVLTKHLADPQHDPHIKISRNDLILAWTKTY